MTRRRVLHAASGFASLAAGALVACAMPGSKPAPARGRMTYPVLAPSSTGRTARFLAWNKRYGEETGIHLDYYPLPATSRPSNERERFARILVEDGAARGAARIAWLDFEDVTLLQQRRVLRPLEGLARRERTDLKVFASCALQPAYALDQHLYALPERVDAGQLYFNRRHLAEAGMDMRRAGLDFEAANSTWETLRRAALDLTAAADGGPTRLAWHPASDGAPLEVWGWTNGGEWLTEDGRRATFTREENVRALEWLAAHAAELGGPSRLAAIGPLPALAVGQLDVDRPEAHPLLTGRVSMHFDSTRFMATLAGARPDFPIGYVQAPSRLEKGMPVTWARTSGYALVAGAPDETWQALRFLVSEDAAISDAAAEMPGAPAFEPRPGSGPPLLPADWRPLWYPPYTGQLLPDRFLTGHNRTGSKILDEGNDHGLEQLRHARFRERSPAPEAVWPALREARLKALAGMPAREALDAAQRTAQASLDEAWRVAR